MRMATGLGRRLRKKGSRARKGVVNEDGHRLAPAGTDTLPRVPARAIFGWRYFQGLEE